MTRRNLDFRSYHLISLLVGWASFQFQAVPLAHLLHAVGFHSLPFLLGLQVLISSLILITVASLGKKFSASSANLALTSALALAFVLGVKLLGTSFNLSSSTWLGVHFVAGQIIVAFLRLGLELYCAERMPVFSGSPSANRATIYFELGTLVAGAMLLAPKQIADLGSFGFVTLPLFLLCILPKSATTQSPQLPLPGRSEKNWIPENGLLRFLAYLLFFIAFAKSLQWLIMAYGITHAGKSDKTLLRYFTGLAFTQALSTIASVTLFSKIFEERQHWRSGYLFYIGIQFLLALGCLAYPINAALILSEIARRAVEHSSLLKSQQLLIQSIPRKIRANLRHKAEIVGANAGTLLAAGFFYLFTVKTRVVWPSLVLILLICVAAYFSINRLKHLILVVLRHNLRIGTKDEIIHACAALAGPDFRDGAPWVTRLLEHSQEPDIQIAGVQCLSSMGTPNIDVFKHLSSHPREDVQIHAIRALAELNDYDTKIFLVRRLREEIRTTRDPREYTINVLSESVGVLSVPYLLEILDGHFNDRIRANAVEVLGRQATNSKDSELQNFLSRYLDPQTNRRVRANAIVALHANPRYRDRCEREIEALSESKDRFDRGAAAFVIGATSDALISTAFRFGRQTHIYRERIWGWSAAHGHKQMSMLIALLRLGDLRALPHFVNLLIAVPGESPGGLREEAVSNFSTLRESRRLRVLEYLCANHPSEVREVTVLLRTSGRPFKTDLHYLEEFLSEHDGAIKLSNIKAA